MYAHLIPLSCVALLCMQTFAAPADASLPLDQHIKVKRLGGAVPAARPSLQPSPSSAAASDAQAKPLSFDLQCNHDQRLIAEELASMTNIATAGSRVVGASAFYQAMFSQTNKNEPGFEIQVQTKYRKLSQLAFDNTYKVKVTCTTFKCVDVQGNARFAWASPSQKTINICPNWFDNAKKARAADVLRDCQSNNPNSPNWSRLSQFKASKAFTLMHEITHLDYATGDINTRARDYAYNYLNCQRLAQGTYTNSDLCGGVCSQDKSFTNADSLAFVAMGEYFTQVCGKSIQANNDDFQDLLDTIEPPEDDDNVVY